MKIFALSDPHLSAVANKPMDIFGDNWNDHTSKIQDAWSSCVGSNDVVLVSGDISWALKISEALEDLEVLRGLPGTKVLLRGNHDYWWSGLKKVREAAGEGFEVIQNNSCVINGVGIGGSRLWNYPFVYWPFGGGENAAGNDEKPEVKVTGRNSPLDDEKICRSELNRLQNSLKTIPDNVELRICMTHFPPVSAIPESNELTEIIAANNIDYTVYGHLHALDRARKYQAADCVVDGVRYLLTSCDWLDFKPRLVVEV